MKLKLNGRKNGILKQTAEQKLISELDAKLKEAELEQDILKKAVGIFYSCV